MTPARSMRPLAIDLFCGLGGWTDGLLAEGWRVIGFDLERHDYGTGVYPAQLVIQDVLTLYGKQFKDAMLIVASPPCTEFSYMAMPWSRAKQIEREYLEGVRDRAKLTALFDACFRIQREACEAAGHFIPLVVENMRGAQKWVGRSRWNFGSYHLWGDIPALMPMTKSILKGGWLSQADGAPMRRDDGTKVNPDGTAHPPGSWFAIADSKNRGAQAGPTNEAAYQLWAVDRKNSAIKLPGFRFDGSGGSFQTASVEHTGNKTQGMNWSNRELRGQDFTRIAGKQRESDAIKQGGDWLNASQPSISPQTGSKSNARRAASAAIAVIPFELARHIARVYYPRQA